VKGENGMDFPGKIVLTFFLMTSAASAQQWIGVHAGMINYGGGVFYIDQEKLQFPAARFREVPKGKSLRTDYGWVELQLGPWAFLWMGDLGVIRIDDPSLTDPRLSVERGSALIKIYPQNKHSKITIRSGEAVIEMKKPGLYRIDTGRVRVYEGRAQIQLAGHAATVKQGRTAVLDGSLKVSRSDIKQMDGLHQRATFRSLVLARPILEAQNAEMLKQAKATWLSRQDSALQPPKQLFGPPPPPPQQQVPVPPGQPEQ
jgi:hypothetical protein